MPSLAALHWPVWDDYLVTALRPDVDLLRPVPGEPARDALERLLSRHPRPDRLLVHIDSSTPVDFVRPFDVFVAEVEALGIEVWNGRITDIRKRGLQERLAAAGLPTTLAARDGAPDERVIVKTNLNSRGIPEWEMPEAHRAALGWGPRTPSPLDGRDGYVVATRAEVPESWWCDPQAVIERYVDNRYGVFYRVYFVGERVVVCEGRATTSVRRLRDATDRYDFLLDRRSARDPDIAALLGPPAADAHLCAVACAELVGLDFGTIDLVIDDDGLPFVVDLNPTPFWGVPEGPGAMLGHLQAGLS